MSKKSSLGSFLSVVTGYNAGKRILQSAKDMAVPRAAQEGAGLLRQLVGMIQRRPAPAKEQAISFESLCAARGVTENDLAILHKQMKEQARYIRYAAWISPIFGIAYAIPADPIWAIVYLANGFLVFLVLHILVFKREFRVWQVEKRKLASIREFFDEGGAWRILAG